MEANVVNSMCETASPLIESLSGGKANLRMVSNLATQRLVHVETVVEKDAVGGEEVVDRVILACEFARVDPFRAATNNKGIMNGVSAVLLATNNDVRAVEAGAHAYAVNMGRYCPLSAWYKGKGGHLHGRLVMPMAVGIVGGAISSHPTARISLKMLGVKTSTELGEVAASAGLAYNLSALLALTSEGIQSFDRIH
jgi:hydroxymethylglutaryl-CoA reductase